MRIRKNDMVKVIAGRDKGKTGRVLDVNRSTGRVLVEGVMMMKRHTRPNPAKGIKGGIAEKEASIHVSNVMALTGGGVPTRIGVKVADDGRRIRVARKNGEELKQG
ncbi:MAG TPA: 50S ribosomal protein L24 [Bryobacteraceae bacterium]|nr:50S ribosomal protein L24 [Bryobacteraceae bacterium]